MPTLQSPGFGSIDYREPDLFHFPSGLPAFEGCHDFLLLSREEYAPYLVLHCVDNPELRFACLLATALAPGYSLEAVREELLAEGFEPAPEQWICLALVTFRAGESPTANLLSPIVLSPGTRKGLQVILPSGYPLRHAVSAPPEAHPCS